MQEKHYRHELKYAVSYGDYLAMRARLKSVMKADPHTGADGLYLIRSIYFDNSDDKALMWAVVNVPAPAADDKEAQESDSGVRRVTAFCRLTEKGDKIDTFFKTILACKNGDSANGCSAMMQMLVMPIIVGAFAEDQALSDAVKAAIKPQVAGNNFEVSVTIPHDLAVKLGEFAKAAAKEQLAEGEEAKGEAKGSAPAGK